MPPHRAFFQVKWSEYGLLCAASVEAVSAYFADESNEASTPGYELVTLRAGHTGLRVGRVLVQPFAEVENLLDETYNVSVVVNAFGGRFFEPGPGRTFRLGLNVAL